MRVRRQFSAYGDDREVSLERTKRSGYRFLSVGANPIRRPFGRLVFVIDPDGVLVEFISPLRDSSRGTTLQ